MLHSRNHGRARWGVAAALGALVLLGAGGDASALPLVTLSGSLRGQYGTVAGDEGGVAVNTPSGQQLKVVNPYGLGLQLAAGATLPLSLYVGASFDLFFGE